MSKLQEKNRMYKKLAENAEEMATANLARLRRAQVSRTILENNLLFWIIPG